MASRSADPTPGLVLQQAKHYMRYLRHDQGETIADIAASESVSLATVKKSVDMIAIHRGINTQENLNFAVVGMMVSNLGHVSKTFKRMFNAKNYVEEKRADGSTKLIPVDDVNMQAKALEIYQKYLESMQPKASGNTINVRQENKNQAAISNNIRNGGYEQMLGEVIGKAQAHSQLPSITADVIDDDEDDEDDD